LANRKKQSLAAIKSQGSDKQNTPLPKKWRKKSLCKKSPKTMEVNIYSNNEDMPRG
jgi:hypothetical protein